MQDFHKLGVWQKSHQLVLSVYTASAGFPASEQYGLTSQVRRAAASIPTNIAEGCGRKTNADLRRFLFIAMGSAFELEYHLLLAHDLNMLETSAYQRLNEDAIEVKRMLTGLIQKLSTKN